MLGSWSVRNARRAMASTEERNSLGLAPKALYASRQGLMRGCSAMVSSHLPAHLPSSASRNSWTNSSGEGPLCTPKASTTPRA